MKAKKRTAKAITLLTRIETLLSDVWEECSEIEKSIEKNVWALLRSAEVSIAAAKDYFIAPEAPKARRKTTSTVGRTSRHTVVRKRVKAPIVAKKRTISAVARKAA